MQPISARRTHAPVQHVECEYVTADRLPAGSLHMMPDRQDAQNGGNGFNFRGGGRGVLVVRAARGGVRVTLACVECGRNSNAEALVEAVAAQRARAPPLAAESALRADFDKWFDARACEGGTMTGALPSPTKPPRFAVTRENRTAVAHEIVVSVPAGPCESVITDSWGGEEVYFKSLGILASQTPPTVQRIEERSPCFAFVNNQDSFQMLSASRPVTVGVVDASLAQLGFVVGDVVLSARFSDGTTLDGSTLSGDDFATALAERAGTYTVTVLSQGGVCAPTHLPGRRDLPWYQFPWNPAMPGEAFKPGDPGRGLR